MILDENPISQLIAQYRKLKAQRDAIDAELAKVKATLEPLVEAVGKWEDKDGYARVVTRSPSVSYSNSAVDSLAEAWCKSDDPVMASCGEMLRQHRKEKSGYQYVQIK